MADSTTATEPRAPGAPDGTDVVDDTAQARPRGRRISREMLLMLIVPPVLIALVFLGFVAWRATADLDGVETNQLRWSEITSLIVEHLRLTFVSAFFVVVTAIPAGIMLTRGRARAAAPIVVGIANAGQAAPSAGLIVLDQRRATAQGRPRPARGSVGPGGPGGSLRGRHLRSPSVGSAPRAPARSTRPGAR